MQFYLGTHQPHWLALTDVPLFVSHRRLATRVALPKAKAWWALDSGGFSELSMFGGWETTPAEYVAAVARYDQEIGQLEWAAPQDWMCEPVMLEKTGLAIVEHQQRTVANFVELLELWPQFSDHPEPPFMPVLQGWRVDDYLRCIELYAAAGVRLDELPVVGVGSVCRRQHTGEIGDILRAIRETDPEMPIHGFGVKSRGLRQYGDLLASADSMAWSFQARKQPVMPGHSHKNCANCLEYALDWRERALRRPVTTQMSLFEDAA